MLLFVVLDTKLLSVYTWFTVYTYTTNLTSFHPVVVADPNASWITNHFLYNGEMQSNAISFLNPMTRILDFSR